MLDRLRAWLFENGVAFREAQHAPTRTSEESARARGEALRLGGKALLIKTDDDFCLFVLPADRKLDAAALRRELGVKRTRFATPEELAALTGGLAPGSVPPFGPPMLPFQLFVDSALWHNDRIAFNAGSLTDSMILAVEDYRRLANPTRVFAFSRV